MDFMVSGLVVDGHQWLDFRNTEVLAMEPDSTSKQLMDPKKPSKEEIKREKNRESSARSRKRKRDEDGRNIKEIERLEEDNRRLMEKIKKLKEEGRSVWDKVDPFYFTQPYCKGCYPKGDESGEGASTSTQEFMGLAGSNASSDQEKGLQGSSGAPSPMEDEPMS